MAVTSSIGFAPRQAGMATLLMSLVLLAIMSVMAIYTSRSSLMELTLTNNAYRAKQAAEAAEAGLDYAVAYYLAGGADQDGNGVADTLTVPTSLTGGKRVTVAFCDPNSTLTNCLTPASLGRLRIIATGYSDDDTAVSRVGVLVSEENFLRVNPKATLTAKGAASANLTGNLTVINNMGPTTIWTGTDIAAMNGSFETKVRINGSDNQISSEKVGSKFFVGPDVVYNDHSLRNLSLASYFQQMTGRTQSEMAAMADIRLSGTQSLPAANAANDYLGGKVIYVDKATFDPNTNLGTATKPVILIVNGAFEINGPNTIYGVVIANSLNKANGNARINGALIVGDVNNANGGFTIEMMPTVINGLNSLTVKSSVGNSWRDWD